MVMQMYGRNFFVAKYVVKFSVEIFWEFVCRDDRLFSYDIVNTRKMQKSHPETEWLFSPFFCKKVPRD